MELLLPALYFLVFSFLIYRFSFFKSEGIKSVYIIFIFFAKVLSGIALWAIYNYYYNDRTTSDIFKFFDDATIIYDALNNNPLHYFQMVSGINAEAAHLQHYYNAMSNWDQSYNHGYFIDNRAVIRFNAIVYLFSFGNYFVHIIFVCFLSLCGLMGIYKTFYHVMPEKNRLLILSVFLIPSVVLWTSGVLKEGLLIAALGIFFYSFNLLVEKKANVIHLILILFTAWVMLIVKSYVFVMLFPGLIAYFFIGRFKIIYIGYTFLAVYLASIIIALNLYRINPQYDILYYITLKQKDFINVALDTQAGSAIELRPLSPNFLSVLKNTPHALFNSLLRPHIFEAKSLMLIPPAIENLFVIVLTFVAMLFFKKPPHHQLPLFYFSICFVFFLAVLIGLVTPVLGAVVRYKVPLLPFLVIILMMLINKPMLVKKYPVLNRFI